MMRRKCMLLLLVAVVLLTVLAVPTAAAAKKRKAWTQKELDDLEKAWEEGDEEEELDTPERRMQAKMEARKNAAPGGGAPGGPMGGMGNMMGGGGDGPVMLFVDLLPESAPNGQAWTSPDIDVLNKRWRALLLSGGVEAALYNLDDKILVSLERKLTTDLNEFLLEQPEVDFLTLDSKKIYPKGRRA